MKPAAMAAAKEYMNIEITGARMRRGLSLHLGKRNATGRHEERAYNGIPNHELRRLVASMVD